MYSYLQTNNQYSHGAKYVDHFVAVDHFVVVHSPPDDFVGDHLVAERYVGNYYCQSGWVLVIEPINVSMD